MDKMPAYWTFRAALAAHRQIDALIDSEAAKLVGQGVPMFDAVSQARTLIRKRLLDGETDVASEVVAQLVGKE